MQLRKNRIFTNESDRYKDATTTILTEQESIIKNTINQIIRQYTKDEILKNAPKAQDEIVRVSRKPMGLIISLV